MSRNIQTTSFTEKYIERLTDYIEENYIKPGKDLSRLAIVFGGKRPPLFLKRELSKRIKGAYYPPRFFTIDEFIAYTVRKKEDFITTQDLDNCYLMYQLAKEHAPAILKGRETFAQFLPWTREIIHFIDNLDLEHVDNKTLKNIEANAQIGYSVPDDINRLLEHVVLLREAYHTELQKTKMYSRGLQYYKAAQIAPEADFSEFDQILLCNFFYFNRSEEAVAKCLHERGLAAFIFQGDERKWPVLSRIAKTLETEIIEGEKPSPPKFNLNLYSAFDAHSQVGMVREVIKGIKNLDNTVIVLPNPELIVPLLSEVTSVAKDFNISMGYPLKRSSLYSLFQFIFDAQLSKKGHRYYARDYLKVLSHPFIKNLKLHDNPAAMRIFVHKIEEVLKGKESTSISGSLFFELEDIETNDELYMIVSEVLDRMGAGVNRTELGKMLESVHRLVFSKWEEVRTFAQFAESAGQFLDVLTDKSFLKRFPLNINIAGKMYAIKDELASAAFKDERFPQEDLFRIFDAKVAREIVSFIGSPLKGLQILGLFETRSLNFENVIILDVNEGILPTLNVYEPLIPREVMISLNLDRLELEEEIQRYQFMRLISSAKNVHLVYRESKDKERSRFVEELLWEEQKRAQKMEAVNIIRPCFDVKIGTPRKKFKKSRQMVEKLKKHRYSASSINTYLRNPMDFYYQYVLGLREEEDLLDEPEARHVGTFVHELLEHSFLPFKGKRPIIDKAFRTRFVQSFEERFDRTFTRSMKSDSFLLKNVMAERLNRFLDHEMTSYERSVDKVLYLEEHFEDTIRLSCGDIRFGYVVDRIDKLKDGTIMIIDYKTGAVDQMPKKIEQIATMELNRANIRDTVKSFQIPLYFHHLHQRFKDEPINAALYNLRTLEMHKFLSTKLKHGRDDINAAFLRALDFVMCEILNPDIDFVDDPLL